MLRVLTLNLLHGQPGPGAGDGSALAGSLSAARIADPGAARAVLVALAEQVAELAPDVVALQEVDLHQARSGRLHQAAVLAQALGMPYYRFAASYAGPVAGLRRRPLRSQLEAPTHDVLGPARAAVGAQPIGYGNALLSRHPVSSWHVARLGRGPSAVVRRGGRAWDPRSYRLSPASSRVMVAATIELDSGASAPLRQVSVASTHLATRQDTAARQLRRAWEALARLPGPHVLAGDYNLPAERVEALNVARQVGQGCTFPAGAPSRRIDHVLTDPWPAGPRGQPQEGHQVCGPGQAPLLRAVGWGTRTFLVSDHAGTWVDLVPVQA
ncbi:endonuclease/exonuclease/phosphatase family protein [Actinomyces wuliandei]|uniref:endonuclease/exonuclease/phosphatase family protein n=1 Tax=Actinomyces wuliandei TaxID=2057743 RepID=UPI000FD8D577|nr:endonuclease/exonuclease/phosphatase family protein [Actinomyces wuliandei]